MIFVAFTVLSCFEAGAQAEVMAWEYDRNTCRGSINGI